MNEKVYQFNEYVLGYDKGLNDRSCLTISKIQNDTIYFMGTLYDGSAEIISIMLDNFQKEIRDLQQERDKYKSIVEMVKEELKQGITFCENDSQGHYDICNITINREKKILKKIKELEEGNNGLV